jgi:hypothetical protein
MTGVGRPKNSIRDAVRIRSPPSEDSNFDVLEPVRRAPWLVDAAPGNDQSSLEEKIILPRTTGRSASALTNSNIVESSKR